MNKSFLKYFYSGGRLLLSIPATGFTLAYSYAAIFYPETFYGFGVFLAGSILILLFDIGSIKYYWDQYKSKKESK